MHLQYFEGREVYTVVIWNYRKLSCTEVAAGNISHLKFLKKMIELENVLSEWQAISRISDNVTNMNESYQLMITLVSYYIYIRVAYTIDIYLVLC